jgi:hypothetical protein
VTLNALDNTGLLDRDFVSTRRTASRAKPPNLRRLDSKKKYPQDIDQVHDDGEIWSACLWQIRAAIGRKTADKLIIAHW